MKIKKGISIPAKKVEHSNNSFSNFKKLMGINGNYIQIAPGFGGGQYIIPKQKRVTYRFYSTIWVSAYLSSHASRNSGVMCRASFGQISLHWEQKMHCVT